MKTILLLATALVLLPGSAMASSSRTSPPAKERGPIAQVTRPCTPFNPCAVPTPAIGTLPLTFATEGLAHDARRSPHQTR